MLGGRSTCRITGEMLFNGRKMTKPVKRKLGFVTQDDMLFAEVRERVGTLLAWTVVWCLLA